jgi:phosphoribosylformimino-5-aminoimidazole carboxamide ribotide isomerase
MLIPSIDLMEEKIVQLVGGEKKALEFTDFEYWIQRFSPFPLMQVIDLDAAMRKGNNRGLVDKIIQRLPCQVGGGIRSIEDAKSFLESGAQRVILGSSLVRDGQPDASFAEDLAAALGSSHLVFAVDSRAGKVAVDGWRGETTLSPIQMIQKLEPWCSAFLYTHIETEGTMQGIPLGTVRELRSVTERRIFVAGGIRSHQEVEELDRMGLDAVVGMAIYTSQLRV